MARTLVAVVSLLMFLGAWNAPSQPGPSWPKLAGPYLGQTPPGRTPQVFAPGIVSTEESEACSGFMDEGRLFLFTRMPPTADWKHQPLWATTSRGGTWSHPEPLRIGNLFPYNFNVAPDGRTLLFTSLRLPDGSGPHRYANIWRAGLTADGWTAPVMFAPPVNTDGPDAYPTITRDGTLYFMSVRSGGFGKDDLYRAPEKGGSYPTAENLGPVVNSEHEEVDPFVAADGSFLLYCSNVPGGRGGFDLYVTFSQPGGAWSKPVNMGPAINSPGLEFRPYVTQDGRYLFFTRYLPDEKRDAIYWVDARVIQDLRTKTPDPTDRRARGPGPAPPSTRTARHARGGVTEAFDGASAATVGRHRRVALRSHSATSTRTSSRERPDPARRVPRSRSAGVAAATPEERGWWVSLEMEDRLDR